MATNPGALLFKEKQIKVLLALLNKDQEWNTTALAKAADATYVHTSKFVTRCEKMGLVQFVKHGKVKALTLTAKGNEVADGISKVIEKMNVKVEPAPEVVAPPKV